LKKKKQKNFSLLGRAGDTGGGKAAPFWIAAPLRGSQ
jgi:hypothetical protein